MSLEETILYVGYELCWMPRRCPHCWTRIATAHGVLYSDPISGNPEMDAKRKAIGEVFHHDQGDDCKVMFPTK
jgi:hypothetical protein